ncbi:TPA: glutamine--tRNA ligase/YqeY domain fusion protein [Legionella pneumophila]|uniref:glutamine--tRNA ligase/YqeY domain fusion protein n=1 Tax=Legionella pneumophila TaxID=446 RepID=UPI0007885003|nr:glutamine--tRNA ligase/YqeY domain fusion protein [Legionella pneumophila]MDW8880250.1 glutamine--tRNA ligase/YqeY domain fusion protein [Legionella pneumophila subsp. fraseri]MDW8963222.1 glutamine--tRNA ligase/YqeY domain fusion protein [Legionella pneumophila subsp. fraseri]MDW9036825.1 glutamine--tRNA ligase/YqeY domain fusion protein [Legionella pneumophila subsp. fraseri]MDW9040029.1 glutamine--tRNA ligase/YqeY domain fusion protein [Legionella pneumophila subsp. fraseri]MDW9043019.1 
MTEQTEKRAHFIRQLIIDDLASGKHQDIITRFPPEPNGYLHVGHAKSICLNFGLAEEFKGKCFLRFDDTNPIKEEEEYVKAIIDDVRWLGFEWCDMTHSSDYYHELYELAIYLIKKDMAYVDSLSMDEIRAFRGTLQEPGRESPYRNRTIEENLDLFARMKAGEFPDGTHVLRAKIDMKSGNLNMRDPVLYRIRHARHQRTGDEWCIYPMYDYAHPISDALEKITHSLCTLEFQDHRPLYDWLVDNLPLPAKPVQTEFARLNLSHTVTSKRKLRELVEKKIVSGWDDPRLPTLRGMRKRGYPPAAIRQFCEMIGISRSDSVIDMTLLEECVRAEFNKTAKRALCVMDPLKIVIVNYPENRVEQLQAAFYPQNPESSSRNLPFSREIYIEKSDFMENPPNKYFRLSPGAEVRLRHAYVIKCQDVIRNDQGEITELHCTYDENTLGKNPEDRKVKGVIHWVSCAQAYPVTIYQYDRLFTDPNPAREEDYFQFLNHDSLQMIQGFCEPAMAEQAEGDVFQFERLGYYCVNSVAEGRVQAFHRVVDLKDTWGKVS